jgi:hypothetical protein
MQIWLGKQWLGQKERPEADDKSDAANLIPVASNGSANCAVDAK